MDDQHSEEYVKQLEQRLRLSTDTGVIALIIFVFAIGSLGAFAYFKMSEADDAVASLRTANSEIETLRAEIDSFRRPRMLTPDITSLPPLQTPQKQRTLSF